MIFKKYLMKQGIINLSEEDGATGDGGETSTISVGDVGASGSSAIDNGEYEKGGDCGDSEITQGDLLGGTRTSDIADVETCINFAEKIRKKHLKALYTDKSSK